MEILKDSKELTKDQVFRTLHKYLDKEKESSINKCMSESSFDKPSWSEFQAFQLGYQRALFKLSTFIPNPLTKGNEDV